MRIVREHTGREARPIKQQLTDRSAYIEARERTKEDEPPREPFGPRP